ncbi:MAG: PqqD family protein [Candidatus Acidiferrum sp.]
MCSTHVRFVRNQEVVSRKIEGELIIVPIRSGVGDLNSLYTLNPVGSVLWEFMNEGHTVAEMVERICDEFEVTTGQAQQDIEVFLDSLVEEKLVEPEPELIKPER